MENNSRIFLTSDLWFYRHNAMTLFGRPFADVNEMNETLIENWNCAVGDDDTVFVLGGFNYDSTKYEHLLNNLRGKIILVPLTTDTLVVNQNYNFLRYQFTDILSSVLNRFDDVPSKEVLAGLLKIGNMFVKDRNIAKKMSEDEFTTLLYGAVLRYMISQNNVNAELADMVVSLCSAIAYKGDSADALESKLSERAGAKWGNAEKADLTQTVIDAVNIDAPCKYWTRLLESDEPFILSNKNILEIPEHGVVLSAYPLLDWNGKSHGVLNIHGGMTRSDLYEGRFNVRTDLCGFAPVGLQSIIDLNKIVNK